MLVVVADPVWFLNHSLQNGSKLQIDPKICSRLNAGGQPRGQNYGLCYDGLIVLIVALLGWLPFLQVSRVRVCD